MSKYKLFVNVVLSMSINSYLNEAEICELNGEIAESNFNWQIAEDLKVLRDILLSNKRFKEFLDNGQ